MSEEMKLIMNRLDKLDEIDEIKEKLGEIDGIKEKLGEIDEIKEKLGEIDEIKEKLGEIDGIKEKLSGIESKMEEHFDNLEGRFNMLEKLNHKEHNMILEYIEERIGDADNKLTEKQIRVL